MSIIDTDTDVNTVDNNGWTALMHGSEAGQTEIVKHLIVNGADD